MTGTALIVEDHPEQAELVARILGMRSYQSMVAENGETALAHGQGVPSRRRPA